MKVDICFSVRAPLPIPADHGYVLYSAMSVVVPLVHSATGIAIHPISGRQLGNRLLATRRNSRVAIRADASFVPELIPLSGKRLQIGDGSLVFGVPSIHALSPDSCIRSRIVTIKGFTEPDTFRDAVKRQLVGIGIVTDALVEVGKRRTVRVKGKEIVGFETLITGLSAVESVAIQESGIGGRHRMGCGVFLPVRAASHVDNIDSVMVP